jgi:hypothetical protein
VERLLNFIRTGQERPMTSSISARPQSTSAARVAVGLAAAAVVALIGNTLIALAVSAMNPGGVVKGLTFMEFGSLTVAGVLIGAAGWAIVRRASRRPRAVLRVLVPVVVVLTFGADIGLMFGGTTLLNALGLMLMHVVVAAATVFALARVLPLSR